MRRILLFQSLITVSVVTITLAMVIAGRAFIKPPETFAVEGCHLPCWNNLRPGETNINQATNMLRNLGYRPRRVNEDQGIATNIGYVAIEANPICEVGLTPGFGGMLRETILRVCEPMPIGEVLNLIGEPESMLPIASLMIFQDGQTILTLRMPMCDENTVSAHAPIRFISLADSNLNVAVARQVSDLPWEGFLPFWRYGQLYPDKAVCPLWR